MSGGIQLDLAELQRFIANLQRFDDELAASVGKLDSHWMQLGRVWRDEKFYEFAFTWEDALEALRGYLDDAPDAVEFLRRKASQAEEYLG